jgi:hypothetical protein
MLEVASLFLWDMRVGSICQNGRLKICVFLECLLRKCEAMGSNPNTTKKKKKKNQARGGRRVWG